MLLPNPSRIVSSWKYPQASYGRMSARRVCGGQGEAEAASSRNLTVHWDPARSQACRRWKLGEHPLRGAFLGVPWSSLSGWQPPSGPGGHRPLTRPCIWPSEFSSLESHSRGSGYTHKGSGGGRGGGGQVCRHAGKCLNRRTVTC